MGWAVPGPTKRTAPDSAQSEMVSVGTALLYRLGLVRVKLAAAPRSDAHTERKLIPGHERSAKTK